MCRVASLECVGLGIDEAPISYDVRAWVMDRAAEGRVAADANAQSRMADRAE
jgi:hypothetical protein